MSKKNKIRLITATLLVLTGLIIFGGVMAMLGWDFTKLSTVKTEMNTYKLTDTFKDISVITNTADIKLMLSEDGTCKVECFEEEKARHSVTVEDGTLKVKVTNEKKWYDYIGINFITPKITVYLPHGEYSSLFIKGSTGDIDIPSSFKFSSAEITVSTGSVDFFASCSEHIKIKGSTGNVYLNSMNAGDIELSLSTGDVTVNDVKCNGSMTADVTTGSVKLTDVECRELSSSGSTGNILLKRVTVDNKLNVKRSTGDVKLDSSDAAELFIKTSTGNVKGSLLSGKEFIAKSSTGTVDVPKSTVGGGKCEINTGTGNIKITIN